MKKKLNNADYAENAAKALADLNMVGAILSLCESSLFSAACHPFESRVVRLCKAECQRCLKRYDDAIDRIQPHGSLLRMTEKEGAK